MPKGMVKATCASNKLVARRTCGTRRGPHTRRHVARSLAEATELALAQRPVHDDSFGGAAFDGHGRVGDRRAGPAAPRQPRQTGVAQLGQPQIGGHEGGFVAVLGERGQAVDVVDGHAGIGDGGQDGLHRQLVLADTGDAAPLGVPGLTHADQTGGAPPVLTFRAPGNGSQARTTRRGPRRCALPSNGGRRSMTHGEPWARKGAPA